MRIAKSKQDVLLFREEGINFEYDKDMMNTFVQFLKDIGAHEQLGSTTKDARGFVTRLHESLMVNNPLISLEVNFIEVYPKWMMAVVYGKVDRYGNNVSALSKCFNTWYKENANLFLKAPKIIHKNQGGRRFEDMRDSEIKSMFETIESLDKRGIKVRTLFKGMNNSFDRIKSEYNRRFA